MSQMPALQIRLAPHRRGAGGSRDFVDFLTQFAHHGLPATVQDVMVMRLMLCRSVLSAWTPLRSKPILQALQLGTLSCGAYYGRCLPSMGTEHLAACLIRRSTLRFTTGSDGCADCRLSEAGCPWSIRVYYTMIWSGLQGVVLQQPVEPSPQCTIICWWAGGPNDEELSQYIRGSLKYDTDADARKPKRFRIPGSTPAQGVHPVLLEEKTVHGKGGSHNGVACWWRPRYWIAHVICWNGDTMADTRAPFGDAATPGVFSMSPGLPCDSCGHVAPTFWAPWTTFVSDFRGDKDTCKEMMLLLVELVRFLGFDVNRAMCEDPTHQLECLGIQLTTRGDVCTAAAGQTGVPAWRVGISGPVVHGLCLYTRHAHSLSP
ncbi:hypothetical protein CYMTET_12439 [Cymbomonas tetramitiformis]|uniref:Uncharacterized protein n=1 Tax=Cymbomonas tetramitiformis TaxID=36881 RepID=A0AAE0GK14_9CHLO|nr:hypothetical protein CYMTET_12439 [Cymbomonas tetramitiformis]